MRHLIRSTVFFTVALLSRPASADDRRLTLSDSVGASFNGHGVQNTIQATISRSLYRSPNPLFSKNAIAATLSHAVTPAYSRVTGQVEISPVSILDLRAGIERSNYFGTFGSLQSFASYRDKFDDDARDLRRDEAKSGTASRVFAASTIKIQVGSIAGSVQAEVEWWRASSIGPFFYEPARDTLLRGGRDRAVMTTAYLMKVREVGRGGRLAVGLRHAMTYVFDAPENRSEKVGVALVRDFGAHRFGMRAPRVSGHVSYYLRDPNRRGQLCAGASLSFELITRGSR